MDATKKRGSRQARAARTINIETMASTDYNNEHSNEIEISALAISPIPDELDNSNTSATVSSGECRRSSRKKIIKFDVRDLLNKNRKPHKIQIEARIDSNTPAPKKSIPDKMVSTPRNHISIPNASLAYKQKNFLEKSAIFEKYTVVTPKKPPPPPALIVKSVGDELDVSKNTASLLRAKRGSSLIVAKMESNTRSTPTATATTPNAVGEMRNIDNRAESNTKSIIAHRFSIEALSSKDPEQYVQQKEAKTNSLIELSRRGARLSLSIGSTQRKLKTNNPDTTLVPNQLDGTTIKRRGRPAKNKTVTSSENYGYQSIVHPKNDNSTRVNAQAKVMTATVAPQSNISTLPPVQPPCTTETGASTVDANSQSVVKAGEASKSNEETKETKRMKENIICIIDLDSSDSNMESIAGFDEIAQDSSKTENKQITAVAGEDEVEISDSLYRGNTTTSSMKSYERVQLKHESSLKTIVDSKNSRTEEPTPAMNETQSIEKKVAGKLITSESTSSRLGNATPPRRVPTRRKTMHAKFLRETTLTESETDYTASTLPLDNVSTIKEYKFKKMITPIKTNDTQIMPNQVESMKEIKSETDLTQRNINVEVVNILDEPSIADEKTTVSPQVIPIESEHVEISAREGTSIELHQTNCIKKEEQRQSPKPVLSLPPKKKLSKLLLARAIEQKQLENSDKTIAIDQAHEASAVKVEDDQNECIASLYKYEYELVKAKSHSPVNFKQLTAGTASPARSDTQSPFPMRKSSRRSDRRIVAGGVASKTLEETFAEIAAVSTREVLESPISISDEEPTSLAEGESGLASTVNQEQKLPLKSNLEKSQIMENEVQNVEIVASEQVHELEYRKATAVEQIGITNKPIVEEVQQDETIESEGKQIDAEVQHLQHLKRRKSNEKTIDEPMQSNTISNETSDKSTIAESPTDNKASGLTSTITKVKDNATLRSDQIKLITQCSTEVGVERTIDCLEPHSATIAETKPNEEKLDVDIITIATDSPSMAVALDVIKVEEGFKYIDPDSLNSPDGATDVVTNKLAAAHSSTSKEHSLAKQISSLENKGKELAEAANKATTPKRNKKTKDNAIEDKKHDEAIIKQDHLKSQEYVVSSGKSITDKPAKGYHNEETKGEQKEKKHQKGGEKITKKEKHAVEHKQEENKKEHTTAKSATKKHTKRPTKDGGDNRDEIRAHLAKETDASICTTTRSESLQEPTKFSQQEIPEKKDKHKSHHQNKDDEVIPKSNETTPKPHKIKSKSDTKSSPKSNQSKKKQKQQEESVKPSDALTPNNDNLDSADDDDEDKDKSAKRKRQKKLKEAFEAALREEQEKNAASGAEQMEGAVDQQSANTEDQTSSTIYVLPPTPTDFERDTASGKQDEHSGSTGTTNDSPDPLKDIEKFIADGVNLLKKDYTIDEDDSVENVIKPTPPTTTTTTTNTTTTPTTPQPPPPPPPEEAEAPATIASAATPPPVTAETTTTTVKPDEVCTKLDEPAVNAMETMHTEEELDDESMIPTVLEDATTADISSYLTPADTPITTPSTTPPPISKSPALLDANYEEEESPGVRRSHRIKQIIKAPKQLVGRGLVREKERFMLKDDVETRMSYSLDDHLTDLAEVEAKNVKFLKEMEERLCNFLLIKENEYHCERIISKEARKMICECFLTPDEEERGELGCGDDCLNRLLMIECSVNCKVKERCTNKRYFKQLYAPCRVFRTEKKGFGIMADVEILAGEFIMEYIGEVINGDELRKRQLAYSKEKNRHYYFMALRGDTTIDATIKGNISRFINHSCDPNAETQKWTVNGELRIGFFSLRSIKPGEEITFNYQYERYGRAAQRCYCESTNCSGWIGEEPNSDEGEQIDDESISDEDDEEEDDEEIAVSGKCLLDGDEASSDEDITDIAEAQKKLEMAAAEASLTEALTPEEQQELREERKKYESSATTEDSKNKLKLLFSKLAERVAEKRKLKQKQKKTERRKRRKDPKAEGLRSLEDPDVEDEVNFLVRCGLKNQADTLRLSRLMVRAKLEQTRLDLLRVLRIGELPCRRLFLDYNGLHLLHGWMSESADNLNIRLALLETLLCLPTANKTVLKDTKVYQTVLGWSGAAEVDSSEPSPNEDSTSNDSTKPITDTTIAASTQDAADTTTLDSAEVENLKKLASELINNWNNLPEIFRIPKRERIEQMKEHEREADLQYAATGEDDNLRSSYKDRYERDRFGRGLTSRTYDGTPGATGYAGDSRKRSLNLIHLTDDSTKHLSKEQRREMFAAKVARDEEEKRAAEKRREFETKCRFFGLDPKTTRPEALPFCVNHVNGQWFSIERKPIETPPAYAHVQVPTKPKSTDPDDYDLPPLCATLPPTWKYAITPQGYIYYYHIDQRKAQWEPPTAEQLQQPNSDSDSDVNREDDDLLLSMTDEQLKAYIKMKVEQRRQKRYKRLVQSRPISPRREEDRLHNQIEMRKYKENKEKIRKRKEKLRYRRIEMSRTATNSIETTITTALATTAATSTTTETNKDETEAETTNSLPIPDYLLSSDEENLIHNDDDNSVSIDTLLLAPTITTAAGTSPGGSATLTECISNSLLDKIVEGDKIVDELDAITLNRVLKRTLPPHGEITATNSPIVSTGSGHNLSTDATTNATTDYIEAKKRKMDKREKSSRKSKESNDSKYRRHKERFRTEIAGIIVHHLKPYYNESCARGRIQTEEDFNHLARKLTHFVMIKEQKYCESVGQKLVVTESVKNKSREFIKKYMAKYGDVYIKSENDPEYKDINVSIDL